MDILPGAEPFSHDGGKVGVLLCHDYTGSPQSLRGWAEQLAERGYTVRLPRLPGHGTTWQDLNRTRWTDWFGQVEQSYAELSQRCEQVFCAGLSMGGLLATRLAQVHPEVAGLVLVNPIYAHDNKALRLLPVLKYLVPSMPGVAGDIREPGSTELAYDRNPLKAMHSQTRLWRIVAAGLPALTTPVLLLRSIEDHVVPAMSGDLFLSRVGSPDVTEIRLTDSYHVATLDFDAQRIIDESVAFFERLR